jgi:hypothetical protein
MSAATAEKAAPATTAARRKPRTIGGVQLPVGRSAEARRMAAAILEVLAGARTPTEAAQALAVSVPRYYQIEARALAALLTACEARPRGRQADPANEAASLRRENQRLQRDISRHQALARAAQRTIGLTPPTPPPPRTAKTGKRRRRRPVARALAVARRLQTEDAAAPPPPPAAATS